LISTQQAAIGMQWRTLTKIVGEAKKDYIVVEGTNLNYFAFYMVKNDKY
jgi:hypothetical protein